MSEDVLVLYEEDFDGGGDICIMIQSWKCATTFNKAAKIHIPELSKLLPAGICQKHLRVLAFVLHRELYMGFSTV